MQINVGRPAMTYKHKLCVDTGCSLQDLPGAVDEKDRGKESENSGILVVEKVYTELKKSQ